MARYSRREVLWTGARLGLAAAATPWLSAWSVRQLEAGHFAQELVRTPRQTEGPFYPRTLPIDIKGHPGNARDGILRGIGAPRARDSVIVDFAAKPDSKIGELAARFDFDIVLGVTPEAG